MTNDARKITIEILGEGTSEENSTVDKKSDKKQTKKMKKEIIKANVYKDAVKQVINNAVNIAEFQMNRYFTLSEDYMTQNLYNNVRQSINKANQIRRTATNVAFMAASGNIPGAIITGVSSIINEGMQYYQRMSGYYQALNATNYQTGFSATRAGLVNDSRGTEN